jgi:hypothetical protein
LLAERRRCPIGAHHYPLAELVDALRYVHDGLPRGKVVITV